MHTILFVNCFLFRVENVRINFINIDKLLWTYNKLLWDSATKPLFMKLWKHRFRIGSTLNWFVIFLSKNSFEIVSYVAQFFFFQGFNFNFWSNINDILNFPVVSSLPNCVDLAAPVFSTDTQRFIWIKILDNRLK